MKNRRARVFDALAILTAVLVVVIDQWTKAWVVDNLSPSFYGPQLHLVGDYLILYYIKNNGAAFSLFANSIILVLLIAIAICVVAYLYVRNINTDSLWYKLIFGLIIGGALSNLIDRLRHGGFVVDFISFNIPQLNFHAARRGEAIRTAITIITSPSPSFLLGTPCPWRGWGSLWCACMWLQLRLQLRMRR